ncbi:MAG: hypothetical protein ACK4MQ_09310 [Hyphomonas sp.]
MARFLAAALLLALAAPVQGCAAHLAQGYRSTPDYPAYASASCSTVLADQALGQAAERRVEKAFGTNVEGRGPKPQDIRGGLLMAFVFALAEERPMDAGDACAGMAAAQSSAARRRR